MTTETPDTLRDAAADEAGRAELAVEAERDPAGHHGIHHEADTELAQMLREVRIERERLRAKLSTANVAYHEMAETAGSLRRELTKARGDAAALRTALQWWRLVHGSLDDIGHAQLCPTHRQATDCTCGTLALAALGEAAT